MKKLLLLLPILLLAGCSQPNLGDGTAVLESQISNDISKGIKMVEATTTKG
jgi:uncharacterized lipoprotein YajG